MCMIALDPQNVLENRHDLASHFEDREIMTGSDERPNQGPIMGDNGDSGQITTHY